jgi:hypothetical protein
LTLEAIKTDAEKAVPAFKKAARAAIVWFAVGHLGWSLAEQSKPQSITEIELQPGAGSR